MVRRPQLAEPANLRRCGEVARILEIITPEARVKALDFGLAKPAAADLLGAA